jgi:hypothetical protein
MEATDNIPRRAEQAIDVMLFVASPCDRFCKADHHTFFDDLYCKLNKKYSRKFHGCLHAF